MSHNFGRLIGGAAEGCRVWRWRSLSTGFERPTSRPNSRYDAVIVGAGHNGLVAAAYLQKAGKSVCVLERRHIVGGAACTEEIVPGFKFSRASYLLSLLRPDIWRDLGLKERGVKLHFRDPHSYTPMLEKDAAGVYKSLLLGRSAEENSREIAKFSARDARAYAGYERHLEKVVDAITPLLDAPPPCRGAPMRESWSATWALVRAARRLGRDLPSAYDLVTAPAIKTLRRWFESEPLIATLATDSVIGAMLSPYDAQSGYVLLHHVMGELEGVKGAWAYVEGGMGALSDALAAAARSYGAHIFTESPVDSILIDGSATARGVRLAGSGAEVHADVVLSNATARVTYLDLVGGDRLPDGFESDVRAIDYSSPVTKINVAVSELPSFLAAPNGGAGGRRLPLPHHQCTIHLNSESAELLDEACSAARRGEWSPRPVIEMTIPSAKDGTLAPPGCHVVQLFTMYTPYALSGGREWDERARNAYADCVFDWVESYAPGFRRTVVGRDVLAPPDLERLFGLTGGNIFQGAMSFDQLYLARPTAAFCGARTPVAGLYLCGAAAHPGGGVMGAPGRLAADAVLCDLSSSRRRRLRS